MMLLSALLLLEITLMKCSLLKQLNSEVREFQYQMQITGMQAQDLQRREDNREKAKASRISQQNTEQSKLIDQRKNNLPPINFESNEDSLDGFDLAEFSPR